MRVTLRSVTHGKLQQLRDIMLKYSSILTQKVLHFKYVIASNKTSSKLPFLGTWLETTQWLPVTRDQSPKWSAHLRNRCWRELKGTSVKVRRFQSFALLGQRRVLALVRPEWRMRVVVVMSVAVAVTVVMMVPSPGSHHGPSRWSSRSCSSSAWPRAS